MGFGLFFSFSILILFLNPLVVICQRPNTDEYFVYKFLQKMGLNPSAENGFNGSLCSRKGISCDEDGENIVKLELSGSGLSGPIPDTTICKLTKLETLDLSNNTITSLPDDFWDLGTLINLNLSFNDISGIIPDNVSNFVHLRSLDLSFNNFNAGLPESITSLAALRALNLSDNRLGGPLRVGFGSAFPELEFLNLARNRLLGRASSLFGLKSIRSLNISRNLFVGSVGGVFQGSMEVIDVSGNRFQGRMSRVGPNSTFDWSNLVYLDVSVNQFSGEFSADLSLAVNLEHLNLAHNRFHKQPFLKFDMLSKLEFLNLSKTNMIGPIPSNISLLTRLRILDLSRNRLTNRIPRILAKSLQALDFSNNELTGDIPYVLLQELHNMETFNFSCNNLSFCSSRISTKTRRTSFIGLRESCPIAADSAFFRRKNPEHKGLKFALIVTVSMACLLAGLLFLAFGCRYKSATWNAKQNPRNEAQTISSPYSFQTDLAAWVADVTQPTSVPVVNFHKPLLNFTFADLLSATSNFDRGTLLSEGRFGHFYDGLLPGGIHVALKVLVRGSTMTDREAARELEYLGRIKHHNLVVLVGYCVAGDRVIVIYEFMEKGNLQNLLFDGVQTTEDWEDEISNAGPRGSLTTWQFRHNIALGTARALAFLHHGCSPPIIHSDVRAGNVYLDSNLEPRLSDFGLAKFFENGLEDGTARGSQGYVAQESGVPREAATLKSDVFGFGVILFELITGKKPDYSDESEMNLVSWVRGLVRMNQESRAIDLKIRGTGFDEEMAEALKIGHLCTAENPAKRPSMHQVVGLLKDLEPIAH